MRYDTNIADAIRRIGNELRDWGAEVEHERWQGLETAELGGSEWNHWELMSAGFISPMPQSQANLVDQTACNLPWAEDHFQERVGGKPLNPGNTYMQWPHWRPESEQVLEDGKFTHTYMERFWPKKAGDDYELFEPFPEVNHQGIRYNYGDLDDVVNLLLKDPYGRQAYLPIFFPEDTGAVHGGRIPCTLGYHFMLRGDKLHMWYEIRSCDYIRHFRDDIYMAVRLAQWILQTVNSRAYDWIQQGKITGEVEKLWDEASLGNLTFLAHSMHCFMGDRHAL